MDLPTINKPNGEYMLRANSVSKPDTWCLLRKYTTARIGIGRAGGSQRTASILDFKLAHARAKDAVLAKFFPEKIAEQLRAAGFDSVVLHTKVSDKQSYLMNPELGRQLSEDSAIELAKLAKEWGKRDFMVVVSDGLSALAANEHAVDTIKALFANLPEENWYAYPIIIAPFARVKIQDAINEILHARHTLALVGERPGLGSPDSLSAYFTYNTRWASVESDRNCVSNIRPLGLPIDIATKKLAWLLEESRKRKISGTALKDTFDISALQAQSQKSIG